MDESNQNNQHRLINSLVDLKDASIDLFRGAKRNIFIYSNDLDPRILNNRDVESRLIQFIKQSRNSRIKILIKSEQELKGCDHRIVALAQRFTSYVEIKLIPLDYHDNHFGFYLVDSREIIYRSNNERYEAEQIQLPSSLIKEKTKLFDQIWQMASPASFLRALNL